MGRARLVAVMLAFAALMARAEQMKFDAPRANGYRVDACRAWGQGCGKDAADAFCRLHDFESASAFEIDPRIGAKTPTMTIEDKKICNQPQCDGFKSITCTRADRATGLRRIPEGKASTPPAGQSETPGKLRVPPGLADAFKKKSAPPAPSTPPPAPNTPANPTPPGPETPSTMPGAPVGAIPPARLDPAEFVVISPKSSTATLGRFGAAAPTGRLEEQRTVPLKTGADLLQTGAADVDGDGQSELVLLETPDPLKPGESELRFFKLDANMTFVPIAQHGVFVGKGLPMLTTGRLLSRGRTEQALVYTQGEGAAVAAWKAGSATEVPVEYVIVEGWQPKGALIVVDVTGDGQDDILDYSETGSLDLVTLGPVETAGGQRLTRAATRQLLMLGPRHQFGLGDFNGDGRTDLLIHDGSASTASIVQFENGGAVRSRTPIGADWPASSSWSRGFDYDGDGRDDLIVSEPGGRLTLRRFANDGSLRDVKVLNPQANPDNLRFPGYFTASGRASQLTHHRGNHAIVHVWFEVVGDGVVIHPAPGETITTLVENVPEGALVVVGNFRKDR